MANLPNFLDGIIPPRVSRTIEILNQTKSATDELLENLKLYDINYLNIKKLLNHINDDIEDATKRIKKETIRVGILGGRGSGKSTLANALMEQKLLPESAIVFCTSIPTTINYSKTLKLSTDSKLPHFNYDNEEFQSVEDMRKVLEDFCKESRNPNNEKQITKIEIGVPSMLLEGKEFVDVPGFTKGNPLHQAFAERYAKYYCDVCLVLVNNCESIQIEEFEGLKALTKMFENRLTSVIFIINKRIQYCF